MRRLLNHAREYFRLDIYRRVLPYTRPYRLAMVVVVGIMLAQNW